MKAAPLVDAIRAAADRGGPLRFRLVHTGQHYDRRMSGAFFDELGLPEPDVNFEVGPGPWAEQAGAIMQRYEALLGQSRPAACVVVGDVTSTMACAVVARRYGVPVGHVEGGLRSHDWTMPEELHRVVTDAVTNWFFTTSDTAGANLRHAGVEADRIFFVGNTMIDTLMKHLPSLRPPSLWTSLGLTPGGYCVLTLHRPANVDDAADLVGLVTAISRHTAGLPVVFPVHPRTAQRLASAAGQLPNLHCVEPLGYLEFNYLVKHAKGVITDSGGVTEETTVLGVPCLTLRNNTERPETVSVGTNELIGTDPARLGPALARLMAGQWKRGSIPEKWDGRAAGRIVQHLEEMLL